MGTPDVPLVLPFGQLSRESLPVAGGKAASLGEMTRAGFPVPPGFCVTTAAYQLAVRQSSLGAVLEELEGVKGTEVAVLSKLAERAREALLQAEVPEPVQAACAEAYRGLGGEDPPVAVRSSATAEDLPDASFAGQHETLLNVVGEKALLDAVRECWSSLFTERAVVYRAQRGIQHRAVHLAVAVQRMVDAAVAGVMFTANPVTGRRTELVIDASPGLGEAIVSGAVNPDHFVLERGGGKVLERKLGDKALRIESVQGGGTRQVRVDGGAEKACVSDAELAALVALGERMERHAGAPQDLEWALDRARRPLLLQSRPITTLYPLPAGPGDGQMHAYFSGNVAQGVLGPITPIGLQAFRLIATGVATIAGFPPADPLVGPSIFQGYGDRLWLDLSVMLRSDVGRALMQFALARMEARTHVAMQALMDDPRFTPRRAPRLSLARTAARILFRLRIPLTMARALTSPARARARCQRLIEDHLRQAEVPASASPSEKLDGFVRLVTTAPRLIGVIGPTAGIGMGGIAVTRKVLGPLASREDLDGTLRALPHNPTTEMDLELWGVADEIGRSGDAEVRRLFAELSPPELSRRYRERQLPEAVLAPMDRFLQKYGVRAVAEIDLGVPRWGEDPTHLMGSVANYLTLREHAGAVPPDEQFRRASAQADAAIATLVERAERAGEWKGTVVRFALSRVRGLAGLRELIKFAMIRLFGQGRRLILDVGAALAKDGRLERAEDAVFLDVAELRRALAGEDMRARVRERRAARDREQGRRHIPRLMLSDGTDVEATLPAREGLTGTPASAGRVTAVARVVMDPVGARLDPGEILVAPSTDPGWTPLFLTAAGLVMEMGGAMSHGAVVAREYGIPAVVGVPNATHLIRTGQRITVDGSAGVVSVEGTGPAGEVALPEAAASGQN